MHYLSVQHLSRPLPLRAGGPLDPATSQISVGSITRTCKNEPPPVALPARSQLPPVSLTHHPECAPRAGIYCRLRDDMKLSRRKLMTRASAAPGMLLSAVA